MVMFDQSGTDNHGRPQYLELLFKALCSTSPTSVESERAFSTVDYFATKLKTNLGDKTTDVYVHCESIVNKNNEELVNTSILAWRTLGISKFLIPGGRHLSVFGD